MKHIPHLSSVSVFNFSFFIFHFSLFTPLPAFAQSTTVTADFSTWADYPLVKKIGVYETPLVTRNWLSRDLPKLAELEARSFRYEFAWGKDLYTSSDITGTASALRYNWGNADYLFDRVAEHTPAIIFCHGYMPAPLQSQTGNLAWQAPPKDYARWEEVNAAAAEHWRQKGYSNRYVEVWNEPDLPGGFFSGSVDDYVKIYQYAAMGAKNADPDVKVGGPGGALQWWHAPLVSHCQQTNTPLDFISGHAYGTDFTWQLNAMRSALNALGNRSAEMLLTEYSPYAAADYAANGPVERAEAAMTFFGALPTMLQYTDLTHVTWAQYIDPQAGTSGKAFDNWDKLGLVDGNYGFRKALFNAFKLYGMMPIDRCNVTLSAASPLNALASVSNDCATLAIWNPTDNAYKVTANLRRIPFTTGRLQVYHIDETVNSWYETGEDDLRPTMERLDNASSTGALSLRNLDIRPRGILFIRFAKEDAAPLFPQNRFARIVSTQQWYEASRTNSAPYALFDSKTWTARLSTCGKANGTAILAVTAEDLPQTIRVTTRHANLADRNTASSAFFRIDFQNSAGQYLQSVVFHGGIYHPEGTTSLPWGSRQAPTHIVPVDNFNDFTFRLADFAPTDFSGRAIITFQLAQTGSGSKCNFKLHRTDELLLGDIVADSVTTSLINLHIGVCGSLSDIAEAAVIYAPNADPLTNNASSVSAIPSAQRITATIPRLQPNQAYHLRGKVVATNGETIYTPETVIHTPARPVTLRLTSVKCDTIARTAKLSATVSSSPSAVYRRGFVWAKSSVTAEPTLTDNVITAATAATGAYTGNLSNLDANTEYAVRAFSFSRAGVNYSSARYFSTNPYVTSVAAPLARPSTSPGLTPDPSPVGEGDFVGEGFGVRLFDLQGRPVTHPRHGVFLVVDPSGKTRKVYLK